MALDPSIAFSGQVFTTDPTYPLGKARDEAVEGDGNGTPWTADLVNDIWGFQQALLDAAGIDALNIPDAVGASQYLEALQTIDWEWIGAVKLAAASNELGYSTPRTRTVRQGPAVKPVTSSGSFSVAHGKGGLLTLGDGVAGLFLQVPCDLPQGAVITGFEVRGEFLRNGIGGGADGFCRLQKEVINTATASGSNPSTLSTVGTVAVPDGVAADPGTFQGGGATYSVTGLNETVAANAHYFIELGRAGVTGSGSACYARIYAAEVTFTETRASGHY